MTLRVVGANDGPKEPKGPEVQDYTVTLLEDLLAEARLGEIQEVHVLTFDAEGFAEGHTSLFTTVNETYVLGALDFAKRKWYEDNLTEYEEEE
jgi:hypothetical protein